MQVYTEKEINIEAKENTSPVIKVKREHNVTMSCGCTQVELPNNIYTFTIEPLPLVRHMVPDVTVKNYYIKTVTNTIEQDKYTIKIKVTI